MNSLSSKINFILKDKSIYRIVGLFLVTIFIQNCAEPEDNESVKESAYENTLTNQTVGDGSYGAIDDYFYDFNDAVDAKFFRYSKSRFGTSYDKYITSYPYPPDNMIMKNFPDYLLDVAPDSIQFVVRHPIDTLVIGADTITSNIGKIVEDSLVLSSSQFKNLESIE